MLHTEGTWNTATWSALWRRGSWARPNSSWTCQDVSGRQRSSTQPERTSKSPTYRHPNIRNIANVQHSQPTNSTNIRCIRVLSFYCQIEIFQPDSVQQPHRAMSWKAVCQHMAMILTHSNPHLWELALLQDATSWKPGKRHPRTLWDEEAWTGRACSAPTREHKKTSKHSALICENHW